MITRKIYAWVLIAISFFLIFSSWRLTQKDSPENFADGTALDKTQKLIVETYYDNQSLAYLVGAIVLSAIATLMLRFEK